MSAYGRAWEDLSRLREKAVRDFNLPTSSLEAAREAETKRRLQVDWMFRTWEQLEKEMSSVEKS